ncbi:hypothetical protein HDU96_003111 [Phlyctochytrium bullatum]|nr:hypothetical protein HDU96_003111 [Phlyctochytrium bullatum]
MCTPMEETVPHRIREIEAVLLTHGHADAMLGLDDLRQWTMDGNIQKSVKIYLTAETMEVVARAFPYMVDTKNATGGGAVPTLEFIVIDEKRDGDRIPPFMLDELLVQPFEVEHGKYSDGRPYMCTAFKIGPFTYMSDVNDIPPSAWSQMEGTDVLVIDALKYEPHASHFGISQAIDACVRLSPSRAFFTGFSHKVDHETLLMELAQDPQLAAAGVHAEPGYDGQIAFETARGLSSFEQPRKPAPVNSPKVPTAGDLSMMAPNRKVAGGNRYVTARKVRLQQQKKASSQQSPASHAQFRPAKISVSPKQPPLQTAAPAAEVPETPVSSLHMSSGQFEYSIRSSSGSEMPEFRNNHPSLYTYRDSPRRTEAQSNFSPNSPLASEGDPTSPVQELQELSPPLSNPASPRMATRKRAPSNPRLGSFDSPVASLLGRLDEALTVALGRDSNTDPSFTPTSLSAPEYRSNIFQLLRENREAREVPSTPSTILQTPVEEQRLETEDAYLEKSHNCKGSNSDTDSMTSSLSDYREDNIEVVNVPTLAAPPGRQSGKSRSRRKLAYRGSRGSLRMSTREKKRSIRASVTQPSRDPSPTTFLESPVVGQELDGQFQLNIDYDVIRAMVDSANLPDEAHDNSENVLDNESSDIKSAAPAKAPRLSLIQSIDLHLESVDRAISAIQDEKPSNAAADQKSEAAFKEKRKMRQSVVRRLDGVLLEAMEATGEFFDENEWDDGWEDIEDQRLLDEITDDPTSLMEALQADSSSSEWVDDAEIAKWRGSPLQPRPEAGEGVLPAGGRMSTPDLGDDFEHELSLPRRHLHPEDLQSNRHSGSRNSGGPTNDLRALSASNTAPSFPGPLSPLQPVVPKPDPNRKRSTVSPKPDNLDVYLYKSSLQTNDEKSPGASSYASLTKTNSISSDFEIAERTDGKPPLPSEREFISRLPGNLASSLARRYQKENNIRPLERPSRRAIISIESTATNNDVGSVWADFKNSSPYTPRSENTLYDNHLKVAIPSPQSATLPRDFGSGTLIASSSSAMTAPPRLSMESTNSGGSYQRPTAVELGRRPSLFSKLKIGKSKSSAGGPQSATLPRNIYQTGFLSTESLDAPPLPNANAKPSYLSQDPYANNNGPEEAMPWEGTKGGGGISMARSKSAGPVFGKLKFGRGK